MREVLSTARRDNSKRSDGRFSVTKRIGLIKAENNIETYDSEREETQVKTLEKLIKDSDLDKKFIVNLMKLITTESKKNHEQIKKEIGE